MKERPIIFSGPMVRAILDGSKTQTRRPVKFPQPRDKKFGLVEWRATVMGNRLHVTSEDGIVFDTPSGHSKAMQDHMLSCPYGVPGDRLWVRESFQPLLADGVGWNDADYSTGEGYAINYVATSGVAEFIDQARDESMSDRITPSIFMPRWASRITLEITDVRVQRVQEISLDDCLAEGIEVPGRERMLQIGPINRACDEAHCRAHFSKLWDSINAKKHPWSSNPWVWVLTFKLLGDVRG